MSFSLHKRTRVLSLCLYRFTELPVLVRKDIGVCRRLKLLLVWGFHIGAVVARTCGRKLESLDGEGEVLVVGVVHQEPVVKGFLRKRLIINMTTPPHLDTVGVIAGWDEGTRGARGRALLHPSRLLI